MMKHLKKGAVSRRDFVGGAAASAGAWMLASCSRSDTPTTGREAAAVAAAAPKAPPVSLAQTMPREVFLDYLDATADTQMRVCHHCGQASFLALEEGFGLDAGVIVKALTPLPGIAERGETCGAVVGALLALGLVYGRDRIDDWATWRQSLPPAQAFCRAFVEEYGSTQCGDVQERLFGRRYNLSNTEDLRAFQSAVPGPTELCGGVVRRAVRLAAEIMLEPGPSPRAGPI